MLEHPKADKTTAKILLIELVANVAKAEKILSDPSWLNPKTKASKWEISSQASNGRFNDYLYKRVGYKRWISEMVDL